VAVCAATAPLQTWYRVCSNGEYIFAALFEAHASPEAAQFSHAQCHEVGTPSLSGAGTGWQRLAAARSLLPPGQPTGTLPPRRCSRGP
jgi:hypothetical protein